MLQSVRNFERSSSLLLRRYQSVGVLPWLLVCCFVWGFTGHAYAQSPQQFTGVGMDGVASAIAAFKAAIGGSDNGTSLGSSATGFRQVTWDDVPDQFAAPNYLPGDFYNVNSPRGLSILVSGAYFTPQVSANASNPTSTNSVPIVAERSMYWDSNGVFWAGGLATAGTRLP